MVGSSPLSSLILSAKALVLSNDVSFACTSSLTFCRYHKIKKRLPLCYKCITYLHLFSWLLTHITVVRVFQSTDPKAISPSPLSKSSWLASLVVKSRQSPFAKHFHLPYLQSARHFCTISVTEKISFPITTGSSLVLKQNNDALPLRKR